MAAQRNFYFSFAPLVWWDENLYRVEKRDECIGEGWGGGIQDTGQKRGGGEASRERA